MMEKYKEMEKVKPRNNKVIYYLIYFSFLILGIVLILPFHSLIQALGFLEANLPNRNIEFVVSTLTNGPVFVGQVIMIFWKCLNMKVGIISSLILMTLLWISIPLITEYTLSADKLWIIILSVISIFSFFNGILQSSGYGFAGIFPYQMIASLSNGAGWSGVIVGILRAFSLIVFPVEKNNTEDPNLFKGAILYFTTSSALCVLSLILFIIWLRTEYVRYHTSSSSDSEAEENFVKSYRNLEETNDANSKEKESGNINPTMTDGSPHLSPRGVEDVSILEFHNKHWINLWGVFLNFAVSFVLYPGVMLQSDLSFISNNDWKIWFVIFFFTVSDTLGRVIAGWVFIKSPKVWGILTLLRWGLIATTFLWAYEVGFFRNDYVFLVNVFLVSFSVGYLANWQIIMIWSTEDEREKEMWGKVANLFLQVGILIGSLIATFGIVRLF